MSRFVAQRLALVVVQLLAVVIGIFVLLRVLPADPAAKVAGTVATPEARAQAEKALGLDESIPSQLVTYLEGLARGDFALSWNSQSPVLSDITERLPVTLQFVVLAFILAIAIAIPVGRKAAARPGGRTDKATVAYSLFSGAQPDFWWGLLFVYLFTVKLGVLPVPTGLLSADTTPPPAITHFILIDSLLAGDLRAFLDALAHFVLPVCTLAFVLTGPLIKMTRKSLMRTADADYVLYARACGRPAREVRWLTLRNSLTPVLTLIGILFGFMLGGGVLIEYVFALDGIGRYALVSTLNLDYPAVQGAVILLTACSLIVYLLVDIAYAVMDPRVRYGDRQ